MGFQNAKNESYFLLTLVFIFAALVIWVRTATVRDTYLFIQNEKEFRKLEQATQTARLGWLKLTTPRRLEMIAQAIGLNPPKMNQIIKMRKF